MRTCLVEAVTCSLADALVAQTCGADRIEVCSAIEGGGITPSIGLVREILDSVRIPVVAMIRPRNGHFVYSEDELRTMERDIEAFTDTKLQGVVFGVLDAKSEIDIKSAKRLIHAAGSLDVVFHRAFDLTPNANESLTKVIDLGCTRILTSGHAPTALEGAEVLRSHVERSGIEVLAAASIRPANIPELLERSKVDQVHLGPMKRTSPQPGMYGESYSYLDAETLKSAVEAAK